MKAPSLRPASRAAGADRGNPALRNQVSVKITCIFCGFQLRMKAAAQHGFLKRRRMVALCFA